MCVCRGGAGFPWSWNLQVNSGILLGNWELNTGPLDEQYTLLTTVLSLQRRACLFQNGSLALNSGPRACKANALLMEPLSQSQVFSHLTLMTLFHYLDEKPRAQRYHTSQQ